MKFEMMLSILFELLSKKCVTAKHLSNKYEVSTRSIYRYIRALELAGVPIYSIAGKKGGFSLIDTYKLSSTFMTRQEFDKAIETLTAINEQLPDKILNSVLIKLKASIKNEYSGFEVKSGNLVIDAGPWGDAINYKSKLALLQNSIEKCLPLQIIYHDRNGEISQRIIEPHIMVFKQGLWYVFAYCQERKSFRFFKTGRIESAILLSKPFIRKELKKDDLPLNWHENVLCEHVELEISKHVLSDVEEWLGVENVHEEKGKFIASVKLPYDMGLVSKIMSFGKDIKVLSPQKLINEVKGSAEELLKNY